MPTGYTADLYDGKDVTFEEFVLRCARGMGAAILLRDAGPDVLPTEENVVEGDYAEEKLVTAISELAELRKMSPAEIERTAEAENAEQREKREEAIAKNNTRRGAYEGMLDRVKAWTPPSKDHEGFKEFMIEQLESSISHDCDSDPGRWYIERTPEEWHAHRLEQAQRNIEYYTEQVEKANERNEARRRWIRQLRESLGAPSS